MYMYSILFSNIQLWHLNHELDTIEEMELTLTIFKKKNVKFKYHIEQCITSF